MHTMLKVHVYPNSKTRGSTEPVLITRLVMHYSVQAILLFLRKTLAVSMMSRCHCIVFVMALYLFIQIKLLNSRIVN